MLDGVSTWTREDHRSRAAPVARPAGQRARNPTQSLGVAAIVLLAAGLRLGYLCSAKANFIGDEAVTGIAVRAIMHGETFVFYPGQHYGGTLEIYLQALGYLFLPLPSNPLTLRLVLVVLAAASTGLVFGIAWHMLRSRWRATVAAAFFAVGPWYNLLGSTGALGFYVVGVTLGAGALYCALRLPEGHLGWAFGLGLCAGLGLWNSLTTVYLIAPALLWALPFLPRRLPPVGLGFLAGTAPVLWWMRGRHALPLPDPPGAVPGLSVRLHNMAGPVSREFLGVAGAHGSGGLPALAQSVVVAGFLVAWIVGVLRRRRSLPALLTARRAGRDPVDLLLVAPVLVLVCYVSSPLAWYVGTPRYLFTAYPLLALSVAALLPQRGPRRTVAAAVLAGQAALCGTILAGGAEPALADRDAVLRQVAETLLDDHETSVYAAYPTAMTLQYVAGDDLDVAVCKGVPRFPRTQDRVANARSPVYLDSPLGGSGMLSEPADTVGKGLAARGIAFRMRRIGFVRVYDQLRPVPPVPTEICR